MSEITEKIKEELLKRCEEYDEKTNYNFWEEHIKNAVDLAKEYHANIEIVELRSIIT